MKISVGKTKPDVSPTRQRNTRRKLEHQPRTANSVPPYRILHSWGLMTEYGTSGLRRCGFALFGRYDFPQHLPHNTLIKQHHMHPNAYFFQETDATADDYDDGEQELSSPSSDSTIMPSCVDAGNFCKCVLHILLYPITALWILY